MTLHDSLQRTIASWKLPVTIADDTPLLSSGLLDSVALFNLVLWIEEQTGRPLDPTTVDIRRELDTVTRVLAFVAASKSRNESGE